MTQQSDSSRLVVEVSRRGRLIVGDPYFTPGVPVVLESKGIGDVAPGDLAVVRTGRGRAKVDEVLGPADRIENVLGALLVERGARQPFEIVVNEISKDKITGYPATPKVMTARR